MFLSALRDSEFSILGDSKRDFRQMFDRLHIKTGKSIPDAFSIARGSTSAGTFGMINSFSVLTCHYQGISGTNNLSG